jgi:phosphoglycerate dehydrogenase-like enzyme
MSNAELARHIEAMPRLRWIHSCTAGVDQVSIPAIATGAITMTRSAASHNVAIGEFVLALILSVAKRFPELHRLQLARQWRKRGTGSIGEVGGRSVGIVGAGAVGREIAWRCRAMGMRVLGTRRHPKPVEGFDEVLAADELPRLLAEADFVVLSLPLTSETRGLISAAELARMRPGAWLINVSRGSVVVEADLVEALRDGTIGGACLDVFEVEPLPPDNPLWDLANVVITPHCASDTPETLTRSVREFEHNLRRFIAGERLVAEVTP